MHRFMCMYVCIFIHTLRYTRLQETHATFRPGTIELEYTEVGL